MPKGIKKQAEAVEDVLFTEFEIGVAAPPGPAGGKYQELEDRVLAVPLNGSGASEWMRILFPDKRRARTAQAHLRKRASDVYKAQGHDVAMRILSLPDGAAWLYVQRKVYEAK